MVHMTAGHKQDLGMALINESGTGSHDWSNPGPFLKIGIWVCPWRCTMAEALTCDKAGDNEGQHQHLQHPHEQLTRKREVLDLAVGELVWAQGKRQADT